jgi:hypothetical protein
MKYLSQRRDQKPVIYNSEVFKYTLKNIALLCKETNKCESEEIRARF